jgi:hypothetical protein
MTATVVQFKRPALLRCPKCGATTDAACDCGVEYVQAGALAAAAIEANPELSNRAIAEQTGLGLTTVQRARKSGDPNGSPAKRIGRDGKMQSATKRKAMKADTHKAVLRGPRLTPPDGLTVAKWLIPDPATAGDIVSTDGEAKRFGVDGRTYRMVRDMVLLANRTDLSKTDMATVHRALSQLNESKQARAPYALVAPIANHIWGRGKRNEKTEKRSMERFQGAVAVVTTVCEQLAKITIPPLNHDDRKSLVRALHEARTGLTAFQADIRAKQARREETAHEEALLAAADEAGKLYLDDEGSFAPDDPQVDAICRERGFLYRAEQSALGAKINLRNLVCTKAMIQAAKQAVDAWTTTYHELTAAADEAAS